MLLSQSPGFLFWVLFSLVCGCASRSTLTVPTTTGEARLYFYPSRISEQRLGELVKLGPYRQEDFLVSDIASGQQQLDFIDSIKVPHELQRAHSYARRQVSFYLCLERTKDAYYEGDDSALKTSCDDIDPSIICERWVLQGPLAQNAEARRFLAGYTWHNCMNHEFRERLGVYPTDSWQRFLGAFDIREGVIDVPFD